MPPLLDPTVASISRSPLPKSFVKSSVAIAKWIDQTVPCVVKPQSGEVTMTIITHLRSRGVRDIDIAASMSKSIYQFTFPLSFGIEPILNALPGPKPPPGVNVHPTPGMNARPGVNVDDARREAELIGGAYERARLNGNTAKMEVEAQNLLDLISGYGKIIRDKNKLDEVREDILRNSRNIAPIVRRVQRDGPAP